MVNEVANVLIRTFLFTESRSVLQVLPLLKIRWWVMGRRAKLEISCRREDGNPIWTETYESEE